MNAVARIYLPETWRSKHLSPAEQRVVELVGAGLPTQVGMRLSKDMQPRGNPVE